MPGLPLVRAMAMVVYLAALANCALGQTTEPSADREQSAGEQTPMDRSRRSDISQGYDLLINKAYVKAAFGAELFDQLWQSWESPLREQAEAASPSERRQLAYNRYGFTAVPGQDRDTPLQYADDGRGGWSINCFACHGGKVAGKTIPGAPNTLFAMQTLAEDVRNTKFRLGEITLRDVAATAFPMGSNVGTTNAVMFGVLLENARDENLDLVFDRPYPPMTHHDMDAPPWWNVKKKERLYADGLAERDHRALMQFLMTPENSGERIRGWEQDYRKIYKWILSLEPPRYPFAIDRDLASQGSMVFEQNCAECHGTYGSKETYPNRLVPIEVVGTDRVRLDALTPRHRQGYQENWFSHYGRKKALIDPKGYIAPPLDGIWASAPYFHNGSVPTLWHLLHSESRPTVWRRTVDGYDQQKVGLEVETLPDVPAHVNSSAEKRWYFDTRGFGKSAAGHTFPNSLTESEKTAVLEYLKTL